MLATLVVFAGFKYFQYQNTLEVEAEGFKDLKQDMLALQTEFNKVDKGWRYDNDCKNSGQVYGRDTVIGCGTYLENELNSSPVTQGYLEEIMKRYVKEISSNKNFEIDGQLKSSTYTDYDDSDSNLKITKVSATYTIVYRKEKGINCSAGAGAKLGGSKIKLFMSCYGKAGLFITGLLNSSWYLAESSITIST